MARNKTEVDLGQHHLRNFMGEGQNRRVATNVQDPKYTRDDINELMGERSTSGKGGTNTRKPDLNELDDTYNGPQQERFNRPYAYPPARDKTPAKSAPPTGADKKRSPTGNDPPTPGDNQEYPKNWNIPSDYNLG